MQKIFYLVRHCQAEGQSPSAQLTDIGKKQAKELSDFFTQIKIERVISSPYVRAIQSIEPLAGKLNLPVEIDDRLSERILSIENMPDWLEKLRETFEDSDLKYAGGESSAEAMQRIVSVVEEIENNHTIIVTHGNLLSLLLKYYDSGFGFDEWKNLSNPDVFRLTIDNEEEGKIKRLWGGNLRG